MSNPEFAAYAAALIVLVCFVALTSLGFAWLQYAFILFSLFTLKNIFMFFNGWRIMFYKDFKIEENNE